MKYIVALDQGTTSSRTIVFDLGGTVRAQAQQELRQYYPRPGWVEHDPAEIWSSQLATARQALAQLNPKAAEIAALAIANQRETTLLWERATGRPLSRAIVWQDRRTAGLCAQLRAQGAEAQIRAKTGLVLDPYFSATKLCWLLDNIDGARARAEAGTLAFGTVDTWLLWNLSGGRMHLTDVTNASRTQLFDIHRMQWDEELLRLMRIPSRLLPEVRPSASAFGAAAGELLGLPQSVPITAVAGDQQAALFGQACFGAGMAKNTYGTGAFILLHTGSEPLQAPGVLTTAACSALGEPPQYALEGSVFTAGAAVQWLRDELGIIADAAESERLAATVADNGGVYFVPALSGLGAPHWDPYARGLIVGLTRGVNRGHIARAALEAVAFQTRDALEPMAQAVTGGLAELRVDGGAAANDLLMQFQADTLGCPVLRAKTAETTALGAAWLGALGAGLTSRAALAAGWTPQRRFEPQMSAGRSAALYRQWRRAVERARGWIEA